MNAIATAETYGGIAVGPVVVGVLAERATIGTAMQLPVVLVACLVVPAVTGSPIRSLDADRKSVRLIPTANLSA